MALPIYIFTGFLEGGKTSIIQESMNDERFNSGEKTLILLCEEGEVELDATQFWGQNVWIRTIESLEELTEANLRTLASEHPYDRIVIEYNGMWELSALYQNMPRDWGVYQNMMFADAATFLSYNRNMRQLTVDKVRDAEMVVLNRTPEDIDKEEIHKVIRGISRRAAIVYDYPDGHVEYDEIEDPLPFDLEAPVVEIGDDDYAVWYRDLSEELPKYAGKTVKFKGMVARDPKLSGREIILGRHIMTCCADDIQYSGLVCVFSKSTNLKTRDWVTVKGSIRVEKHKMYRSQGPVLYVESTEFAVPPKQEVATFY